LGYFAEFSAEMSRYYSSGEVKSHHQREKDIQNKNLNANQSPSDLKESVNLMFLV